MTYAILLGCLAATALIARYFRSLALIRCSVLMAGLLFFWFAYSVFLGIGSPGWWSQPVWWPSWPSVFQAPVLLLSLALTLIDLRLLTSSVGSAALVLITAETLFLQQPIGDVNYFSHRLLVRILLLCTPLLLALALRASPSSSLRLLWHSVLLFACSLGVVAVSMTDTSELGRISIAYLLEFALPSWLGIGLAAGLHGIKPSHAA